MALFKKKDKDQKKAAADNQTSANAAPGNIIGFTKPKKFLFFKTKSKPIYNAASMQQQPTQGYGPIGPSPKTQTSSAGPIIKKPTGFQIYVNRIITRHKDLDVSLREQGLKESPFEFVKKMMIYSVTISLVLAVIVGYLMFAYGIGLTIALVLGGCSGLVVYIVSFNKFLSYPVDKNKNTGREVERDILFAARDMVISMRSGMPLFNAITSVSTGYGAASKEFAKVVELVQLGMSIEQAIDEVSSKSKSKTFKSLMLQASVSIKAGADIISALQGVVEDSTQERVIELRRYGQRLNALAMFYMLFGIIFPSMGIAVAAILTTFIDLITINGSTLLFALVGIAGLQFIFLYMMKASRPVFAV